MNSFNNRFYM